MIDEALEFHITTRGAAVESLKKNFRVLDPAFVAQIETVRYSPEDWTEPLRDETAILMLSGIMVTAYTQQRLALIHMDRDAWGSIRREIIDAGSDTDNIRELVSLDPQGVTLEYTPPEKEQPRNKPQKRRK